MSRILLLEDNPGVMRLLCHLLQHYNPIESTNAEGAIRCFRDNNTAITLLVADLTLPASTGLQVALILRCENPDLPVILISGYPADRWDEQSCADLSRLGTDNLKILQKPFYPEVLVKSIQEMVGMPEHAQPNLPDKGKAESEHSPPLIRHSQA